MPAPLAPLRRTPLGCLPLASTPTLSLGLELSEPIVLAAGFGDIARENDLLRAKARLGLLPHRGPCPRDLLSVSGKELGDRATTTFRRAGILR